MDTSYIEKEKAGLERLPLDRLVDMLARARLRTLRLESEVEDLKDEARLDRYEIAFLESEAEIRAGRLADAIRIISRTDGRLRDLEYLYHKVYGH